jgi:cbb3-type cytochrome oxidase subunit 3
MRVDEPQLQLGGSGDIASRAKSVVGKAAAVLVGGVLLASAFVLSLAFFAVALIVALVFIGYVWWKTRALRKQMREHIESQTRGNPPHASAASRDVIEGVVISSRTRDERDSLR